VVPSKNHPHYQRALLSDLNLFALLNSSNRTEQEWRNLVEDSDLTLNRVIISNENIQPEPIMPIIVLECSK
jgi:hypothetical protein